MSHLLDELISVTGFALLALAGVAWLAARPHARGPRRWLAGVVLFYCAASIRAVPWILSRPLVSGFHHFSGSDVTPDMTMIVVLGSGSFTVHGAEERMGVFDVSGAARVLEAAYIYRLIGSPWILSSGGTSGGFMTHPSALTMRNGLVQLGVPVERILLEASSQTTRDEAVLIAPMLRAMHVTRIVLVTSDLHMRRSIGTFRAVGLDPVPAIAENPMKNQSRLKSFIPTPEGLEFTSGVVHEYVGLMYYAARGWLRF